MSVVLIISYSLVLSVVLFISYSLVLSVVFQTDAQREEWRLNAEERVQMDSDLTNLMQDLGTNEMEIDQPPSGKKPTSNGAIRIQGEAGSWGQNGGIKIPSQQPQTQAYQQHWPQAVNKTVVNPLLAPFHPSLPPFNPFMAAPGSSWLMHPPPMMGPVPGFNPYAAQWEAYYAALGQMPPHHQQHQ